MQVAYNLIMFSDLHSKFVIETDSIIVAEVVDYDKEQAARGGERIYPTFNYNGEEIVKYDGRHYRQRRLFGSVHVRPEITEKEIRVNCQGPIKILDSQRRSSLDC